MEKNKRKNKLKRKLIKNTIIGIVVLIILQLFIIAIIFGDKYQCQQANSDNTYTETIYVDHVERFPEGSDTIYIFSNDRVWKLSRKLARKHTEKSLDEICQSLVGASLSVTYKKVFIWWRWHNVIVDAHDEDIVYYTTDEYNALNEIYDQQRIWQWVLLEFIYVLVALIWMLYIVLECDLIIWLSVRRSKKKKLKAEKDSINN